MSDDCECGIPDNAIILSQLHIIEYIDPEDGSIFKIDLSCDGTGENELSTAKYFEMIEWARMLAQAPILADMVRDYVYEEDEDEE